MRPLKTANKIVYCLLGGLALGLRAATLVSPPSLLDEAAQSFHLVHAMRENRGGRNLYRINGFLVRVQL